MPQPKNSNLPVQGIAPECIGWMDSFQTTSFPQFVPPLSILISAENVASRLLFCFSTPLFKMLHGQAPFWMSEVRSWVFQSRMIVREYHLTFSFTPWLTLFKTRCKTILVSSKMPQSCLQSLYIYQIKTLAKSQVSHSHIPRSVDAPRKQN
jgi:hypothetical protein